MQIEDQRPNLLTDNGKCYLSGELHEFLKNNDIKHILILVSAS